MKKFLSLLLVLSMLLTLLASCKKEEQTEGDDTASENEETNHAEKEVFFTEEFPVNDSISVKIEFKGADAYLLNAKVYVNGEEETPVDFRKATKLTLGHEDGVYSSDGTYGFEAVDMNFDGNMDFLVKAWEDSEGNLPYFCYLWNDEKNEFVYGFQINAPIADSTNAKIYSTVYEDGNEYVYIYRVNEDELIRDGGFSLSDTVEFSEDLSAYEEYMAPADRDGYLLLVNKETHLDETFVPEDLTDLTSTRKDGRNTQQMVHTAAMALEALYTEMYAAGYTDVSVTSAYRSYEYQDTLFNNYVNNEMAGGASREEAEIAANTYSARPGTSEHQSGLCCDMHNLGSASQAFKDQEAYLWLSENAWKFGFILRFPEDKEAVTGYMFEPWHYRFVGRYHAEKIHNYGLCLEEYLEIIE